MRFTAVAVFMAVLAGCDGSVSEPAKFQRNGTQLADMRSALEDPLVQFVGIAGVGDSIMWGRTLPENSPVTPRTRFLDTARDNSDSPSFWNGFRKHIGEKYMPGVDPVLGNWSASPSGESVVTYTRQVQVFPAGQAFAISNTGAGQSKAIESRKDSPTGRVLALRDAEGEGQSSQSLSFKFTGSELAVLYRKGSPEDFSRYDLIVDGRNLGTFSTGSDESVATGAQARIDHKFSYVRDKVVELRTNSTGLSGRRVLTIEGLDIPKTIRLTNQGVIGQTAKTYNLYNLSGRYGQAAVTAQDQFVIAQFGTNDRGEKGTVSGDGNFDRNLQGLVDRLAPQASVILMVAGPILDGGKADTLTAMTMQEVRGVVDAVAKRNNIDFIDNLTPFDGTDARTVVDGFAHPNEQGHAIMARNIIGALESR